MEYFTKEMMDALVSKEFWWIHTDGYVFWLILDWKYHRFSTHWDCCSHSYVSNIECNVSNTIKNLYWQKILLIEEMPEEEWKPTTQEYDRVYWYDIELEDWHLYITHRNSSNGYYWWTVYYEWIVDTLGWEEITKKYISPNV